MTSAGTLAAGLSLTRALSARAAEARAATDVLALSGGPTAVTYPEDRHREAYRWPRYGADEERAVLELLRNPSYEPIAAFEKVWARRTALGKA